MHRVLGYNVWIRSTSGSQRCRQSIDLLLELGNPAIGLLLALATGRGDDALSTGLCAAFARACGVVVIWLALDFQPAAGFACSDSLQVVRVCRVARGALVIFRAVVGLVVGVVARRRCDALVGGVRGRM